MGTVLDEITYLYGNETWGDLLTNYDGKYIVYDAIGNPLADGTWSYTWEQGRKLTKMQGSAGTWNYTYNSDGMRISRTSLTDSYSYWYDGDGQLLRMKYNDVVMSFSYSASGQPMSVTYDGTVYYYLLNAQGDVISLTDATTGTIMVSVFTAEEYADNGIYGSTVTDLIVDTYYGYTLQWHKLTYIYDGSRWQIKEDVIVTDEVGSTGVSEEAPKDPAVDATYTVYECQWVADPTATNRLYQVPVIKAQDLDYGHYTAVILVSYVDFMNHTSAEGSYDFYLDSIRIYDSANDGEDNEVIRDAYLADGEGWLSYTELRNQIIEANTFDTLGKDDEISGIVFIDNVMDVNQNRVNTIADYKNFGPNNEVYIAPGQAIAFDLDITDWNADINGFDSSNIASVQLGIKTVGSSTRLKIYDAEAGADSAAQSLLSTATEMYYDMTKLNGKTVVIYNAGDEGDAILSVTNIKATFKSEPVPAATPQPAMLRMSRISTYRRMIGAKKGLPIVGNLPALADEERGKGWRLRKS